MKNFIGTLIFLVVIIGLIAIGSTTTVVEPEKTVFVPVASYDIQIKNEIEKASCKISHISVDGRVAKQRFDGVSLATRVGKTIIVNDILFRSENGVVKHKVILHCSRDTSTDPVSHYDNGKATGDGETANNYSFILQ